MKSLILSVILSTICHGADDLVQRQDKLAATITMELAKKYAWGDFKGDGAAEVDRNGDVLTIGFDGFYVTLSKGGTQITKEEIEDKKKSNTELKKEVEKVEADPKMKALFIELLASDESDFPKIGLRARAADFMGQKLTFTTSDGMIDVHIEDAEPYSLKIKDFAKAISDIYNKQAEQAAPRNR